MYKELIDVKIIRILHSFNQHKDKFFHLQKLSRTSNVPMSTTFRIVNKLVKLGLVEVIVIDKTKLYKISKKAERLKEIL